MYRSCYSNFRFRPDASSQKRFCCTVCGQSFEERYHLRYHEARHALENSSMEPENAIAGNQKIHTNGNRKRFVSTVQTCQKPFSDSIKSQSIKKASANNKAQFLETSHKCNICLKSFAQFDCLKQHMDEAHSAVEEHETSFPNLNKQCKSSTSDLNKHVALYEKIQNICPHCDKVFKAPKRYKRHLLTHADNTLTQGNYPCLKCDKVCATARTLQTHQVTCHEKNVYTCKTCDKSFTSRLSFKSHIMLHNGSEQFFCDTCKKSFPTKKLLEKHEDEHVKRCGVCGKVSGDERSRVMHMRYHEEHTFKCELCQKGYLGMNKLNAHWKSYHKQEVKLEPQTTAPL